MVGNVIRSGDIKNLYFASAFEFPGGGGGFTGALLSGYRVGRRMLDKYFYPRGLSLAFIFSVAVVFGVLGIVGRIVI